MAATSPLIELIDIYKTYHLGEIEVPVLKGISLTIHEGEFVALTGASGSGKTTLMNLLGCLDRPTSGAYRLEGQNLSGLSPSQLAQVRSERLGFVFQNFSLLARTRAFDNVAMPTAYAKGSGSAQAIKKRTGELLHTVGLEDRMDHEPSQLSGGQQQRVAIARALVNRPVLLLADEPTGNLDSRTGREILQVFSRLNAEEGITVLLVTHDPAVAAQARRVIHISDGIIDGDTTKQVDPAPPAAGTSPPRRKPAQRRFRSPSPVAPLRQLGSTVDIAFRALRRNMLRSFLTTLGIIIGIAAVISIMEISKGASTAIEKTISVMGANTLLVLPGFGDTASDTTSITPEDADAIRRECPSVRCVAPIVRARGTFLVNGNRDWLPRYLLGTTPSFLEARNWEGMYLGKAFTEDDVRRGAKVCMIGQTVAEILFGEESPVGKEIRIRNEPFKVIGVLSRKGANLMGLDQDDILLAPWTTVLYRLIGSAMAAPAPEGVGSDAMRYYDSNYPYQCDPPQLYVTRSFRQQLNTPQLLRMANVNQILVQAVSTTRVPSAMREIDELLTRRHRLLPEQERDFRIRDLAEVSNALETTVRLLSGLLLSVAFISLVVGGVGIMNIMLVSVTERTREIGLRMAVGAAPKDILRQFLVEGVSLCLVGGFIGIVIGRGTSQVFEQILGWPTEFSLLATLAAVTVSVTVGVTFSYYPALKASRLDPIEALRYE